MTDTVTRSFGYQLDNLAQYIKTNYHWESPESGFARYVLYLSNNLALLDISEDSTIASIDARRLEEAPILAAVGYELACGRSFDAKFLEAWAKGLSRLSNREVFPTDRVSFFYRPVELLGILLGANRYPSISSQTLDWLRTILTEGEQKLVNSEFWSSSLSLFAANIHSVFWKLKKTPTPEEMTIDELALIKWMCSVHSSFAQVLGFSKLESKVDKALLSLCITSPISPCDISRAVLVYTSLKNTVTQVIQSNWEQSWLVSCSATELIDSIMLFSSRFNLATELLLAQKKQLETINEHQYQNFFKILLQLNSNKEIVIELLKAARQRAYSQLINNQGTLIVGANVTMNSNQNNNIDVQQNFNASVYGGVAGKVEGNQYNFVSEQKQTLAEAAQEIQHLLKQIETSNPLATDSEKIQFVTTAISPTRKERFLSALNAGWKEALKEFFDNAYLNIGIAILEGWKNPGK